LKSILLRAEALSVVVLLAGCSGGQDAWSQKLPATVPAEGIVLLDGQPVEGASIVLDPVAPAKHAASAVTSSGGKFELKAFPSKEGAVPGSYQVGITKQVSTGQGAAWKPKEFGEDAGHAEKSPPPTEWKNALPEKYETAQTSGLTVVIPEGGTSKLKIELKSGK